MVESTGNVDGSGRLAEHCQPRYSSGGGHRTVDRDILHLQIFLKTTIAVHEAGGAAQLVAYLLSAHKTLGSIPSTV